MLCREEGEVLKAKEGGLHKELLNNDGLSVMWGLRTRTADFPWEPHLWFGRTDAKI